MMEGLWSSFEPTWRSPGTLPSSAFQPPSPEGPRHMSVDILDLLFRPSPANYSWVIQRDTIMVQNCPVDALFQFPTHKIVRDNTKGCFKPPSFGNSSLCSNSYITGMASDFPRDVFILWFALTTKGSPIFSRSLGRCLLPALRTWPVLQGRTVWVLPLSWTCPILLPPGGPHTAWVKLALRVPPSLLSYLTVRLSTSSYHALLPKTTIVLYAWVVFLRYFLCTLLCRLEGSSRSYTTQQKLTRIPH